MFIQKKEWGQIRWLHIPDKSAVNQTINVGFTEIAPGKRQPHHVHYGQEQFIYIIEGEGLYIVNGKEQVYKAGMYLYMEPDCTHETVNQGEGVLKELLISNTATSSSLIEIKDSTAAGKHSSNMIYTAIEAMRTQVLESLHLPVTVFDEAGEVAWKGMYFPGYCIKTCHMSEGEEEPCPCLKADALAENGEEMQQFLCPYGLTVFHLPVVYKNSRIGTVRGGHILLSESDSRVHEGVYDTPESSVIGIRKILKQIVKSILSICEFNESKLEMIDKDRQIRLSEERLYTVNDQVTNLKINHHFLFNTLNCMADMALTGSRDSLYDSIINLAKMFRYTMAADLRFVSLESELEYLGTYLDLQKLRYGKSLEVTYRIDDAMKSVMVPFNFLQPVVENAFTHGFADVDGRRKIRIEVEPDGEKAEIRVYNNGSNVDEVTLNRVKRSLPNNNGHGLSFIYDKLKAAYGTEFTMDICSGEKEETCVSVTVPARAGEIRCQER